MIHHHEQREVRCSRRGVLGLRAGFSLIELMVVIALIAVLISLVAAGLNRATKTARRTASERSAAALAQAVDQFKSEFGFLPPLVQDGDVISTGDPAYQPSVYGPTSTQVDGPIVEVTGGTYNYKRIVVWSEGLDFNFFRRRSGSGSDEIELPTSGVWNDRGAWDDRRYSKYSLAYYLTGVLDKDVDGVRGPGFARPIIDGSFLGVGYPVGSVRDRFEPLIDVERRGARLVSDYVEPKEVPEHDLNASPSGPEYEQLRNDYAPYQREALTTIVDAFGNAFRYYRWEPGRFVNGRLTVENQLDLNIPPVLIDPVIYGEVQNDPAILATKDVDLTGGNIKLRDARYAVVSAGPDGFFGTENIDTIAEYLRTDVPSDLEEQAKLRQQVWADNAWEIGN